MKRTKGENIFQVWLVLFVILICATMFYPFLYTLSISLSTPYEATKPGLHLVPGDFSFHAYRQLFGSSMLWTSLQNSLFRTIVGTALMMVMMVMGAYPLSKKWLPHRNFYSLFIICTMFFSGGLIPSYLLVRSLGLNDSLWALVVPSLLNTFSMLILRNFFVFSIPGELEESAKVDGANDARILFSIVLPLSKPVLATVALWSAVFHWNAWFDALIYIQDPGKTILQIYLRRLVIDNDSSQMQTMINNMVTPDTLKAAITMFVTLPIVLVYPFLQKYFVNGIMVGSVKG